MSVSSRLKQYCQLNNITYKILVEKQLASQQTISNYLNGSTDPKAEFLEKFIKEFRVSANWLMTGEGEMFNESKKYMPNGAVKVLQESSVISYSCVDCIAKQKQIDKLNAMLVEVQDKYIKLKDSTTENDLKQKCG